MLMPSKIGLKLGQIRRVIAHSRRSSAGAGDGKSRVERETGLGGGTRLVELTKLRQGCGQRKIRLRRISVCLNRSAKPRRRLLPTAEVELRYARVSHPDISQRVARTEPQRLANVRLCFFGATDISLTSSDN